MSLKSVPGSLVSIAPRLIGVPVAATPGFVPHDEMLTVPVLAELDAGAGVDAGADVAALDAADELLEEELELQPAMTPTATAVMAATAVLVRQWKDLFMWSAFSWLTAS